MTLQRTLGLRLSVWYGTIFVTSTLVLVVPYTVGPDADDALDDAWDVLRPELNAFAGGSLIHWTDATRSTFNTTYPAFTIPVTMKTKD